MPNSIRSLIRQREEEAEEKQRVLAMQAAPLPFSLQPRVFSQQSDSCVLPAIASTTASKPSYSCLLPDPQSFLSSLQSHTTSSNPISVVGQKTLNLFSKPALSPIHSKDTPKIKEESFEYIYYEIMKILIDQGTDMAELYAKMIESERAWKQSLHERLLQSNSALKTNNHIEKTSSTIHKVAGPLVLFAGGAISLATAGVSAIAVGAAAIGGLLFCDAILDDAAKKTVSRWLSRATDESKEAWLGRVQLFTNVVSFASSFGLSPSSSLSIATNVAHVALAGVRAGVDIHKATTQALLLEIETHLAMSQKKMENSFESLEQINKTLSDLYKALAHIYASCRQTHHMIANSV